ncbi:MAG: phosphomethylpyrimidine synthase ThiC [Dehalococcoidales bacterium]|jgi:phosphomethylpyrimidine synthase|nr:phosphomethylpyrimidine synthase ThiC [Dehalococcoidales bacterium]MDD4322072.1 phosphomethylpyrimidine synthase ThiC [Dehalococcoidales bacterium]MDD5122261.1 phosphomethylpyrimidine synthase ThiC [Dehalococcoidales bacterium]MDD5497874.1 phosphomethylpyrimidine synthase ThiC [Dehalococcoidales bacterium]MDX9802489.1 phosphomethylpyrimidine synthase ThiC [Dehalococcoidales bacterium]
MTQLEQARNGIVTPEMVKVALQEGLNGEYIRDKVACGTIVIPANPAHKNLEPRGVGDGLSTKVNANIGTSSDISSVEAELEKLDAAVEAGADAVMDLSTGGDISAIRRKIIQRSTIPLGTVPVYQAAIKAIKTRGAIVKMSADDIFESIEEHAADGVDFVTVHCGVTRHVLQVLEANPRVAGIVSRGGSFLAGWVKFNQQENPLYAQYDRLLQIARRYDVTLSLGDGLRPGCTADATDSAQVAELMVLGELVKRAREAGVQVMVEGPGHLPLDHIEANIKLEKQLCHKAPFYVLGPLVTDIAAGYDHITGAIGGAIAAAAGADFLCYVTPSEHLALPDVEDVKNGVIASRIAAHAADMVKGVKGASLRDLKMSCARKNLDWEAQRACALDPVHFEKVRSRVKTGGTACTMCGDFCAMKLASEYVDSSQQCG